ncbi:MAG: gliding motility-associated C-terminal domain-containing protein [Bacteroidetes bacterium]|nr:gliding motility-associated C-terminal domain-containing protein [Bacteroidota bacterium]
MQLRFFLLLLLVGCIKNASSQTTACVDSSTRFLLQADNAHIYIRDNVVLADSSVIIIGNIRNNTQTDSSMFIARLDKYNNILFSKRVNGFNGSPFKAIQCQNGDILVTMITYYPNSTTISYDPWLFRFDINGNILWEKKIDHFDSIIYFSLLRGVSAISEDNAGNIYLGATTDVEIEIDPLNSYFSGYYFVYKFNSSGDLVWKTALIQNNNSINCTNAISVKNGKVSLVTQQYSSSDLTTCIASNPKTVAFIQLNSSDGSLLTSKAYCLNFSSSECIWGQDSYINEALFLNDGSILIAGMIAVCSSYLNRFSIKTDEDFNQIQSSFYNSPLPLIRPTINKFGQVSALGKKYNDGIDKIYYASFWPDGNIIRQRKLELPQGTVLSTGYTTFAFKKPDDFLVFSNLNNNGDEVLQVMEFKGDNNQTTDCTGEDTAFITSQPHTIYSVPFVWDTVRTETGSTIPANYTFTDFSFRRIEICSSISICDSLKIHGRDSICLNDPEQVFTTYRNPECHKKPLWQIDTSAVYYVHQVNDTTVSIRFKRPWQGYLYAYSNSCTRLLDSAFIKVFDPVLPVNLGNDTTYCSPVTLDAGADYSSYQWQDGSVNRYFTVTSPGLYYVTAKDICNTTYSDTIVFKIKKSSVFIGNDTCINQFPYTLAAQNGFADYQWQNGSQQSSLTINTPGLYYVNATNGCNEAFTDSIIIYKAIIPFSIGNDTIICPETSIELNAPPGYINYQWQDNSSNDHWEVTGPGLYYVTTGDYCGNTFTDTIKIQKPGFSFSAGADTTICKEDKITLTATEGFINYLWLPDYNISSSSGRTVSVFPEISTSYIVSAERFPGCTVKDTILVTVKDCPQAFYIPTAFTPNNDGKNDIFKPVITGRLESYFFAVYNRWGQLVFKSRNPQTGWNGKLNGTPQDSNSFIWICTYKFYSQPEVTKKGSVTLLR